MRQIGQENNRPPTFWNGDDNQSDGDDEIVTEQDTPLVWRAVIASKNVRWIWESRAYCALGFFPYWTKNRIMSANNKTNPDVPPIFAIRFARWNNFVCRGVSSASPRRAEKTRETLYACQG